MVKRLGWGKLIVKDNTIDYLAHAGQTTYNVKLTNNGDVSTGVFEKFRSAQVGWPWAIGYRFYMNTAEDKRFFVKNTTTRECWHISFHGILEQKTMVQAGMLSKLHKKSRSEETC